MEKKIPTLQDVYHAHTLIKGYIHKTPVFTSHGLDERLGCNLFFKCENFQRVGAFKFRGAANAVFSLTEEEARFGVATHSSGNHAAALALASKIRGIQAHIVMPINAPEVKKRAVRDYGANISYCKATLEAREKLQNEIVAKTKAFPIHPYSNFDVICGQATCAVEFLEEIPDLEVVIVPVGGGGLISGTAVVGKSKNSVIKIIGAEPEGANDAWQSINAKKLIPVSNPKTIADGLLTSLSSLTFQIISEKVDDILQVSEENLICAMKMIWDRMKIIIEPSAAVVLAALLQYPNKFSGKKVGLILSGGNVDFDKLPF